MSEKNTPVQPKVMAASLGASAATVFLAVLTGFWPEWAPPVGLEGAVATLAAGVAGWLKEG